VDRPTLPSPRGRNETPAAPATKARRPRTPVKREPVRTTRTRAPRVDVREWLGGLRISGFVVIMLGLVVLGTFVLVPTVGTYMNQRQQIQALQNAVALSQNEVADLITNKKMSDEDAAKQWITEHPDVWQAWMP